MTTSRCRGVAAGLLSLAAAAACVKPGSNPAPASPAPAAAGSALAESQRRYVPADVRFMQHMIVHHAQALEMTALVPERTERESIRLIAQRIEISQNDEIARMQRWLTARGESITARVEWHAAHAVTVDPPRSGAGMERAGHSAMPGMLTPEELSRLASARGTDFDRLFLESMIKHHEGALVMVAELFATDGAGQELDIFRFASDVDTDQRSEIRRMRSIHESLGFPSPRH